MTMTDTGVFQSTHPSGVRLQAQSQTITHTKISIHAPQWGATEVRKKLDGKNLISIHAPQWGATLTRIFRHSTSIYFNPRTPVGCDVKFAAA